MYNPNNIDDMRMKIENLPRDHWPIYDRLRAAETNIRARVMAGEHLLDIREDEARKAARGLSKRDARDVMAAVEELAQVSRLDREALKVWRWHTLGEVHPLRYFGRRIKKRLGMWLEPLELPKNLDCLWPEQQAKVRAIMQSPLDIPDEGENG